jgi:hypothetical protein
MTPVTISDEDWNRFCYPRSEKKIGTREGVPEHLAMSLPAKDQKWTVVYKVYSEVTAPTYQLAIKAAEELTGYTKDHLLIEMGDKQPDYPPPIQHELIQLAAEIRKQGGIPHVKNNTSESAGTGLEKRAIQKRQAKRSSKARKNTLHTSPSHKSRQRT